MDVPGTIAEYYRYPAVRARVAEYCGGHEAHPAWLSSLGMAGYGGRRRLLTAEMAAVSVANEALPDLLADGADVFRSVGDRAGTLIQLDVDYVDALDPGAPYQHPEVCFARLEPVYQALQGMFADLGMAPLVLMTGRGYHFTVRVGLGSRLHADLISIGSPTPALQARDEAEEAEESLAASMGAAHEGVGRLLESLVHRVIRSRHGRVAVPVTLADVPPPGLGPYVCLDLSAYGDPLSSRHARCAFSSHQKAWLTGVAPERPFVLALPRGRLSLAELLAMRRDTAAAARLAGETNVRIPDVYDAPLWIGGYARSLLARFHRQFDREPGPGPSSAAARYARIPPRTLPVCVRQALDSPNPGLLVPATLRAVALVLWRQGWHPRSVADLVRSRYEADHGWGDLWQRYEPAARADFYVRLFAGAVVAGVDDGSDFTCAGHQGRGACPGGECGHELGRLFPAGEAVRTIHSAP